MSIQDDEKAYCFEILEAFYADDGVVTDGFGIQLSLTELDTLKDEIETRLNALTGAKLTIVQALVVDWQAVRGSSIKIEGGGTGNVSGMNMDFEKEQARIRKLLLSYVPVMHIADAIKQKRGPVGSQGCQIPFTRC
jgi:hypothetical protein